MGEVMKKTWFTFYIKHASGQTKYHVLTDSYKKAFSAMYEDCKHLDILDFDHEEEEA
jgi:hypothetical protein